MEHASRGRRSGNKGVGARWRGRFRIFSARHCSRTKVSHAENSGMTMLFFSLEVAPVSEGVGAGARGGVNPLRGATTGVVIRRRATLGEMARGGLVFVFFLEVAPVSEGDSFTPSGEDGTRGLVPGYVPPQERTARGGWFFCLAVAPVSEGNSFICSGAAAREALTFCFVGGRCCRLF